MSEHLMETRRRSRSKTPFLRSGCDHENCEHAGEEGHTHHHHPKKKAAAPNVQTIIEETVEVTSSSSPFKQTQQKIKTSDYSSEDTSPENRIKSRNAIESQQKHSSSSYSSSSTTTTTTSTTILSKSKKLSNSLAAATSTPKANYAVDSFLAQFSSTGSVGIRNDGGGGSTKIGTGRRNKEITQNEINSEFERSQKESAAAVSATSANSNASNRSKNLSFSRIFGSPFGRSSGVAEQSINGNAGEHIAYREYKRAGEYWKTTPKTDYTYSELSPHRRELAPGVVAMPNMSRRSLENHHERIHYMIEREPAQEDYIRRRYESSKYAQNRRETANLVYDSGDEVDLTHFDDNRKKRSYYDQNYLQHADESWLMRIITTVVTTFTSIWDTVSGGGKVDESAYYRTKISNEERGFFGTIGHGISSAFVGGFRYIYLFISSILSLDTWLLQSSHAESKGKKRFLLLLLILLPLLLLAAWQLLDEQERLVYVQRTQALLPVTLYASLRNQFASTGATLKDLFQLHVWSSSYFKSKEDAEIEANVKLYNLQQNIQKSLTPDEYENILNHVNNYVQQLVELKLQKTQNEQKAQITPEMTVIIANLMRENMERVLYERKTHPPIEGSGVKLSVLSDEEVQKIASLVQLQLEATSTKWGAALLLTPAHLAQIRQLITEQIEVNNHYFYTHTIEHIDLEALLARILATPQLARFVDARIVTAIDSKLLTLQSTLHREGSGGSVGIDFGKQQLLIDGLNREIAFIKLALSDKVSENQDLHQSISNLKIGQDDLLLRMQQHELSTDKRFSALLAEIENKLLALKDDQFTLLNQQIKLSLVEILGFKQSSGAKLQDVDLQNWVRNMFVAKDYLEQRLLEINARTNDKITEEIDRSGMLLMRDISERLKQEILLAVEFKHNESNAAIKGHIRSALSETEVQKIVKGVLAIYDADKTGLVDFALESAGGQILSTRCTESYQTKTAQLSVFGIPLWYPTNTPRVAISPNVQPGECWAFQGFPGFLVLKLNSLVYVTGFTLEHIPKTLAPNGRIDSAPRNFTVWGLEHEKDQEPVLFGEYEYADNDASLQYFPLQNKNIKRPYEIVELRIESNHGHPQYTCLYRFRVHGKPPAV